MENAFSLNSRFLLLPTIGAVAHIALKINNNREVAGSASGLGTIRYKRLKNTWPYYQALEIIPLLGQPNGINDDGVIVAGSYRQLVYSGTDFNYSRAINDYGDLCFEASLRGFLYYDPDSNPQTPNPYGVNDNGILPLDQLVVNQDADWLVNRSLIRLDVINNRDSTGLGEICGFAYGPGRGFVLTPILLP